MALSKFAHAMGETFINFHKQISESLGVFASRLKSLQETGWDDEYKITVEHIGRLGWSVSPQMDLGVVRQLTNSSDKAIDRFFYNFFTKEKNKELKSVFNQLKNECHCKNPKRLIEAIQSFNARRYNATAALLFSLIDYQMMDMTEVNKANYRKVAKRFYMNASNADMVLYYSVCFSAYYHIENMFLVPKYKDEEEPKMINRHGIMHSTSSHDVTRKECIQLFNTLDALVMTAKLLEWNSESK